MQKLIKDMTDEELEEIMKEDDFWEMEEYTAPPKPKPITRSFMSFEEAKAAWGTGTFPKNPYARMLINVKAIWDNYANPEGMNGRESLIYELERVFPKDEAACKHRPLGEFKELLDLEHEAIYEELINRFMKLRENRDGEMQSFMSACWLHAEDLYEEYMKKKDHLTEREFYKGMSLLLFQSTLGIYLEGEADRQLEVLINDSKLGRRFRYEEASWELEREDVDAIIVDRKTNQVVVNISIKCLGALSQKTVDTYRLKKKKTKPAIYLGFASLQAAEDRMLSSIKVDGKGLRTLLKEAIS